MSVHNAPDGTLYLADMYTGIIQDAQFVGTYLRAKVQQYQLDKQHNWGRLWRITYTGMTPDRERPRMYSETAAAARPPPRASERLVARHGAEAAGAPAGQVRHPHAQDDGGLVENQLARIHALWTLEGLGGLDAGLAREIMKSPDPLLRIQAIRASESLYKAGDKTFATDYRAMTKDADPNVVIQAMLTLNLHRVPDSSALIRSTIDGSQSARHSGARRADAAPVELTGTTAVALRHWCRRR